MNLNSPLLEIKKLVASIETKKEKKKIIKSFDLTIHPNEIHVIMGPNGSGKSTLSKVLAGHPSYSVEEGTISFCQQNLVEMEPEKRAHEGLFLAFQYPLEIAGVTNYDFLRIAYNEKQRYLNQKETDPIEFMSLLQEKVGLLQIRDEFLYRNVNEGFSGGEKKRNEILQLLLLQPKLIILDEIDSGLDLDAMKLLCTQLVKSRSPESSLLVITHYPKLLTYLHPTHIHIMIEGKIITTGNLTLIDQLEKDGYQSFLS